MLRSRLLALCTFLSLYIPATQAVIAKIDILKGKNPKTGKTQYVYLLGDWHQEIVDIQKCQSTNFINILDNDNKNNIKVIVEDTISAQDKIKKIYTLTSQGEWGSGFLHRLEQKLTKQNIKTANVEYRANRSFAEFIVKECMNTISIKRDKTGKPIIDENGKAIPCTTQEQVDQFNKCNVVSCEDVCEELQEAIEKVKQYQKLDGQAALSYYNKSLQAFSVGYKNTFELLKKFSKKPYPYFYDLVTKGSADEFIAKDLVGMQQDQTKFLFEESCALADFRLLDCLAIHEILNTNKEKIFVAMGAAHAFNIMDFLLNNNYELCLSIANNKYPVDFVSMKKGIFDLDNILVPDLLLSGNNHKIQELVNLRNNIDFTDFNNDYSIKIVQTDQINFRQIKNILLADNPKPAIHKYLLREKRQNKIDYYTVTHKSTIKK